MSVHASPIPAGGKLVKIAVVFLLVFPFGTESIRPILLDTNRCPQGWSNAGENCVRLHFEPLRFEQASEECSRSGAVLTFASNSSGLDDQLILDLAELVQEAINKGVTELTWLIGEGAASDANIRYSSWMPSKERPEDSDIDSYQFVNGGPQALALRRKHQQSGYELIEVSKTDVFPFICALLPITQKTMVYREALLPKGAPRIVQHPAASYHYTTRPDGNYVTLPCRALGNPKPDIRWYRSEVEEVNLSNSTTTFALSGGSLLVPIGSQFSEIVSYHCTATNDKGTVRSASSVIRPAFIEPFRSTRLDVYPLSPRGGGAKIDCQAPAHYPKSYSYSWMVGGVTDKFVAVDERVFISAADGTLQFSYTLKEDANSYACTLALTSQQGGQYGPWFRLHLPGIGAKPAPFAPRIDEYGPQIVPDVPVRGQTVLLECFAYGFPSPSYSWSRADGLPLSKRHRIVNFGRVLKIENVQLEDAVRYTCIAKNDLGSASADVKLIIQSPPSILQPLTDQLVAVNATLTLTCSISATNGYSATAEWFRNGTPIVPLLLGRQDRHRYFVKGHELVVTHAQPSDSGIFQCIVSNDVGSASSSAFVLVRNIPPKFHGNVFPEKIFLTEGAQLFLPCIYHANPSGKALWNRLSVGPARFTQQLIRGVSVLRIDTVAGADSGDYECYVNNGFGEERAIVRLTVLERPKIALSREATNNETDVSFACEVELNCESKSACPEALFDWSFNDRPVRRLIGSRSLAVRESESVLSPLSRTLPPSYPGVPRPSMESSIRLKETSMLTVPKEFTSRNNGRFSCNSLFGSATMDVRSRLLSSMPTQLHVLAVSSNAVKLAWKHTAPAHRRRNVDYQVDGYVVEYRTDEDRNWRELTGGTLKTEDRIVVSYSVTQLLSNQKYQFRVRARTSDGELSVPSSSSEWVFTPPSAPTGIVRNLRWRVLDDTHLLIQWDPIEEDSLAGPSLRYNVSWSTTPRDTFDKWEIVVEPHVIIHSTNQSTAVGDGCKIMAVAVNPLNDVGAGESSTDIIVHFTDGGPKRYAEHLEASPVNASHMELTWKWAGLNECENVVGAKIRCVETLGREFSTLYASDNQSTPFPTIAQSIPAFYTKWLVKDLQPWTDYMCTVTPFDQYGREGRRSAPVFGTTFSAAPLEPPSIRRIKLQETEIGTFTTRLDWTAVNLVSSENSSASERGYRIEVYVSETAEQPVVLTILESELQNPYRPSAKIDGLKLMYFYSIRVAGFNRGGTGPFSSPTSIRIGEESWGNNGSGVQKHSTSLLAVVFLLLRICVHYRP